MVSVTPKIDAPWHRVANRKKEQFKTGASSQQLKAEGGCHEKKPRYG